MSVQYPRLFSLGTFSKTGPTRKQVQVDMFLNIVLYFTVMYLAVVNEYVIM